MEAPPGPDAFEPSRPAPGVELEANQVQAVDNADPDESWGATSAGSLSPFSTDPNHYVPRCKSCHKRFDMARRRRDAA